MSERTVEPTSDEMVQLCRIVERIPEMQDIAVRAAVSLAQLRKDAESPTTFLLEHPDGRLCVAFGLTATEAVLSIGADENPDEWVICDEKKAGRPMRVPR